MLLLKLIGMHIALHLSQSSDNCYEMFYLTIYVPFSISNNSVVYGLLFVMT